MNSRATVAIDDVREHLEHLRGRGWSREAICAAAEVAPSVATRILNGQRTKVEVRTAQALLSVDSGVAPPRPTPKGYAPAEPSRRRYQALQVLGWTQSEIGVLDARNLRDSRTQYVSQAMADHIAATYERLRSTRGGSSKTATMARRNGWLGPEAWWDIDTDDDPRDGDPEPDPDAVDPVVIERVVGSEHHGVDWITAVERLEITRQLIGQGVAVREIARRCGVDERTSNRDRYAIQREGNLTRACRYGQHLSCTGYDAPPGEGTEENRCTCTCHRIGT